MEKGKELTVKTNDKGDKKSSSKIKLPTVTNTQKGLISMGIVAGAAFSISKKKGFLAIMGYMWLGSIGGSGLAYLFKKGTKVNASNYKNQY